MVGFSPDNSNTKRDTKIVLHGTPNYYSALVQNQKTATIPSFTLDSGIQLQSIPVAYSTWGTLNDDRNNVLVVCHALTGSSDAQDWWRPLMGPGKALDYTRYFIFCGNVLGSPYGSASPLTLNAATGQPCGPEFPEITVRDDVRIHKLILDMLGVQSVAAVIGGSMGGMHTLEWPLCTPPNYVNNIVPIATSASQGAWGISWGETQRQAIYADASFNGGRYEAIPEGQPKSGLGTARMMAMLTYRSHGSFESRFGRKAATTRKTKATKRVKTDRQTGDLPTPPLSHRGSVSSDSEDTEEEGPRIQYSSQSYLHYQAEKFLKRFDANCYIQLTKKMDTHDVTRGRVTSPTSSLSPPTVESQQSTSHEDVRTVLSTVPSKALVIGVKTDLLFPITEQVHLAQCLPDAKFVELQSGDGHDGFLLEFETLNELIGQHLQERCPWVYEGDAVIESVSQGDVVVSSVFGEAEGDAF